MSKRYCRKPEWHYFTTHLEWTLYNVHLRCVVKYALYIRYTNTKHFWYDTPRGSLPRQVLSNEVRLAAVARLKPSHKTVITVTWEEWGLAFSQNYPKTAHKHLNLMANDIVERLPNQPFTVLMSNYSSHEVLLPNSATIGMALPEPICTHVINRNGTAIGKQSLIHQSKEGGAASETDEAMKGKMSQKEKYRPIGERTSRLVR